MHNILQTFNILYSAEFIFVQISIQGWINAAHLFPKPSGSNSGMDLQITDPWVCSPNIIFLAKSLKLFNRISFFLLIQVPIKVTMNQNLLHPVLTDAHSLISRGDLNQNVHPLIFVTDLLPVAAELSRRLYNCSLCFRSPSDKPRHQWHQPPLILGQQQHVSSVRDV